MRIETSFGLVDAQVWIDIYEFIHRKRRRFWTVVAISGVPVAVVAVLVSSLTLLWLGAGAMLAGVTDVLFVHFWIRRLVNDPENKILQERSRAIVDEESIFVETEGGTSSRIPWKNIIRIEPYREQYMLFFGKYLFAIVFRDRVSEAEWQEYEDFVLKLQRQLNSQKG